MTDLHIRVLMPEDRNQVFRFITEHWGSDIAVAHGMVYTPHELPGFVATKQGEWIGLITYHIENNSCEIVTIDSTLPSVGIGTALIEAVKRGAHQAGCKRLWLITTNDNLNALGLNKAYIYMTTGIISSVSIAVPD